MWRAYFPGRDSNQILRHSFALFAWDLSEKDQTFDFELLCTIAWGLRKRRNYFYQNGEMRDPWMVVDEARAFVWAFKCIRIHKSSPKREKLFRWKPPPSGVLKLNVDGAL